MSIVDELLKQPPYRSSVDQNKDMLRAAVQDAIIHHCTHCPPYARWYKKQGVDPQAPVEDLSNVPYLPVTVFKRFSLRSVGDEKVVRVLKSSATSSQTPSSVALDSITRARQMRTLTVLMGDLIGKGRRPFIVFDAPPGKGADIELSARVAGMRGYLMMASESHYVLDKTDEGLALNVDKLRELLERFVENKTPICLIGYTYVLYQYVVAGLLKSGVRFELPAGSSVLHFGGWKRLEHLAVEREAFNADVGRVFVMDELRVRDIYGFTEQLGVIYPDDGHGVRLAPAYTEVFARDPFTLKIQPDGVPGLLQFITPMPHSYPGISILLDDMGRVVSRDKCIDGRYGTRFEVMGRARGAEIRGCGDTLPEKVYQVQV